MPLFVEVVINLEFINNTNYIGSLEEIWKSTIEFATHL
jgi:hypothetical protein